MCRKIPDASRNTLFLLKTIKINLYFVTNSRVRKFLSNSVYKFSYGLISVPLKLPGYYQHSFDGLWLSYSLCDFALQKRNKNLICLCLHRKQASVKIIKNILDSCCITQLKTWHLKKIPSDIRMKHHYCLRYLNMETVRIILTIAIIGSPIKNHMRQWNFISSSDHFNCIFSQLFFSIYYTRFPLIIVEIAFIDRTL